MEVIFTPQAVEDLKFWKKSGNKAIQKRIQELIASIMVSPFEGLGKPEPLKYQLSGSWSRRITKEHRLIYEVYENNNIVILEIQSLKGHYKK